MNLRSVDIGFPGPLLVGKGSIQRLGGEVKRMGKSNPLIVTGEQILSAGLLESAQASLEVSGISSVVFKQGNQNPTDETVLAGARAYQESKCDSLIAIGGGSRMDVAKAIRLIVSHSGSLEQYYFDNGGASLISANQPPLICVPTTAGSGSETSRGAIVTDTKQNRKRLLVGPGMTSSLSILDPELTTTMSPRLTAMTGMDALSHAIETYVGKNYHPFAEGLARQAAGVICQNLPKTIQAGNDLDARQQMLIGSAMAAMGFAKGLGVIHALAHQISTEADVAHGIAISILMPYGIAFNLDVATAAYADLAQTMGIVSGNVSVKIAALSLFEMVQRFARDFDLPIRLSDVGIIEDRIPEIANKAMLDHCHHTNPRSCNEQDMQRLLEQAY
jgi:4-hydroxybutyrate dehydrogenase